ncbi:hypothetical protein FSARC_9843 [Fusarium sarcochroum]|uniref:Luciferase domain-containing protein n=1 Tax=Fusarium sarcochroum TaxID=1208366 RepID=A0A8H4TQ31_9HYPO|nr:hypothetical protein FSARC_9843 [Fusarium sarcochroum]
MDLATRIPVLDRAISQLRRASPGELAGLAAGILGAFGLYRWARQDYKLYMSYGPGGLPYNIFGWLVSTAVLRPMGTNVLTTGLYDDFAEKRTWLPSGWPTKGREGDRPTLGPHPLPQRQLNQLASADMHKELEQAFSDLVDANTQLVHFSPSKHEGHTDAIFLNDDHHKSAIVQQMLGEISHIHATGDHSVHVILAPGDCKRVIESGWGQRHPLDGVGSARLIFGWTIPKEYILLYAPRNKREIQVIMQIVRASIGFAANSTNVST